MSFVLHRLLCLWMFPFPECMCGHSSNTNSSRWRHSGSVVSTEQTPAVLTGKSARPQSLNSPLFSSDQDPGIRDRAGLWLLTCSTRKTTQKRKRPLKPNPDKFIIGLRCSLRLPKSESRRRSSHGNTHSTSVVGRDKDGERD